MLGKQVEGSTKIQQTLQSECKWAPSRVQCAVQMTAPGKSCCCLVAVLPQRYRQDLWSLLPGGGREAADFVPCVSTACQILVRLEGTVEQLRVEQACGVRVRVPPPILPHCDAFTSKVP